MAKPNPAELLNSGIDDLLALWTRERSSVALAGKPEFVRLLRIAAELRDLPSAEFKSRLKEELARRTAMATIAQKREQPYPEPRPTASPYLTFDNAAAALDFYVRAFGAVELSRMAEPSGRIGHAEMRIGDSRIMLSDEYPEYGSLAPQSIGGSPVKVFLAVPNVDEFVGKAVKVGATLERPVADQFYGERSGQILDPFGYRWLVATQIEDVSPEEVARRFAEMTRGGSSPKKGKVRPGFGTLTPYVIVSRADLAIEFMKQTFGAEEMFRDVGSAGGYHAELRLEDSNFMVGGGAPNLAWRGESKPMAFHVYVADVNKTYERALGAGGETIDAPADRPYGERTATVRDSSGNIWYIARFLHPTEIRSEGAPAVQPYLHPLRAEPMIRFLRRAFAAQLLGKYETPAGEVLHATLSIGNSHFEMGEATERYPNLPSTFYLYVEDADTLYHRALAAGATSIYEPTDQPYGDRNGGIVDPFGNTWYIGTRLTDSTE
jgi:PhnB protein